MKEQTLSELVDNFLTGSICKDDLIKLQELVRSDPDIARYVNESKEAYKFLVHLQNEQIRTQLKEYDRKNRLTSNKFLPGNLLITIALSILILSTLVFMVVEYYKPVNLAKRNLISIPMIDASGNNSSLEAEQMNRAEQFFLNNNFQDAARLYQSIADNHSGNFSGHAKWNVLMCHLAMHGATADWRYRIKAFISTTNRPYSSKGETLYMITGLRIYNFVYVKSTTSLSIVRPRLI